jgi:hypothetical protein
MAIDIPTRRRPAELVLVGGFVLLGVLAGIAAKAADESGVAWAAVLGSDPAAWVLAVALIGRCSRTLPLAAGRAAAFFAAMTVAYYAWAAQVLGFGWSPQLGPWLLLSTTAVAGAAVASWWGTRRSGPLPGALMALAAGIALAGGAVRQLYWTWTGELPDLAARPVQAAVDVVTALVLVLVLPRSWSTRLWALALTWPLAWLSASLLERLYGFIG